MGWYITSVHVVIILLVSKRNSLNSLTGLRWKNLNVNISESSNLNDFLPAGFSKLSSHVFIFTVSIHELHYFCGRSIHCSPLRRELECYTLNQIALFMEIVVNGEIKVQILVRYRMLL